MSYPFFTKPPGKVCRIAAVYLIGRVGTIPDPIHHLAMVATSSRSHRGHAVDGFEMSFEQNVHHLAMVATGGLIGSS
jgi:hypothetical protein